MSDRLCTLRRRVLRHGAAAFAASVLAGSFRSTWAADKIFTRPVTLIVPWSPGAVVDNVARRLAPALGERFGQPIVIDNRAGAGGNLGAAVAARASDGHTLLLTLHDGLVIAKAAGMKVGFDPQADLVPVGLVGQSVTLFVVRKDSPFHTFTDFLVYAKANPDKLSMGGNGVGTSLHFALELLKSRAGLSIVHVPYKGGAPAMLDVLAGRVDFMIATVSLASPHLQAGTLRPIAVGNAERSALFPDVPTVAESGYPGFEVPTGVGVGLFGPASMPKASVEIVNAELRAVLGEPANQQWLRNTGVIAETLTAAAYDARLRRDTVQLAALIAKLGLKLE